MLINNNISSLDFLTNNYVNTFRKSYSSNNIRIEKPIIFTNSHIMNKTKYLRNKFNLLNQKIKTTYSTNKTNKIYTPNNNNSKNFILKNYLTNNQNKTKIKMRNHSLKNLDIINTIKKIEQYKYSYNKNKQNENNKIYKSVFNHQNKIFKNKINLIDNKFNIINNSKFFSKNKNNLKEIREKNLNDIKNKLKKIKKSVSFFKCVIDYTYPEFSVEKNKILNKSLSKNLLNSKPYYLVVDEQIENLKKIKLKYLQQSFKIKKINLKKN